MADILGYNRDIKTESLVSGSNVALDMGNGRVALVESVQLSYGHQVQPVYETGSNAMYFVHGQPSGSLAFSTLVGPDGFFSLFTNGKSVACGDLNTINLNIVNSNNCPTFHVTSNKNLKLSGLMLTAINFSFSSMDLKVAYSGQFQVGSVEVNN